MKLTGSFGQFALIGGDRQVFDMNLETTVKFFQAVAIKKTNIVANQLGIYSFLPVGRYGKARMNKLTVPRHLLTARTNCLTWTPKGRMYILPSEIDTYPIEYMGEQCTDTLLGDCLEAVLGVGNGKRDFLSTPEGKKLFQQVLTNIFLGLGNSFYDLITYGNDPVITSSDTNDWWNQAATTAQEWADFLDQQMNIGLTGHIPLIEGAKTDGLANFNVDIGAAGVEWDETGYIGSDITAHFDACIAAAPSTFRVALKTRQQIQAVMLVSRSAFDAYKDYIIDTYSAIPASYQLEVNGEPVPGTLMYDGIPVVCMDEWTLFDETVGVWSHRILLTAKGNLATAHDIQPLEQDNGLGLRIERSTRLKDKGAVYMNTTFRAGAAIADTDFMVNGSLIFTPDDL